MAKIVGLPKLSPTMEEGTLVRWAISEGDAVAVDDLLAEVETDKATMEFRSFDKGVILKILAKEGDTLTPDTPVAILGKEGEDISELLAQVESGASDASGGEEGAGEAQAKEGERPEGAARAAGRPSPEQAGPPDRAAAPAAVASREPAPPGAAAGRILASPLVRKLAREHEVDLAEVPGSGPGGRIVKRDLESYLEGGRPAGAAPPAAEPGERPAPRVEKASATRRTIARRLTQSKQEVPHYYLTIDVDAAPLVAARADMNRLLEATGDKVSLNDLIIKACATALRRFPRANASWIDGAIHHHQRVDISVAVAIEEGLLTPVVRNADRKGLVEISREVRELAGRAKDKKLAPDEMTDGTFSVSNLGMYGIEDFAAVINPPEGAILAVGTVRDEPVVQDGQVVPGKRMRMTLSADHRVIDGAVGAQLLATLKPILEHPAALAL
ncbi:MAG: dihydrolipoamide acetyltransferase family protein [Myxococcota bacterium]